MGIIEQIYKKKKTTIFPFPKGGRGRFNMLFYNPRLKTNAGELRNNLTDAERMLWLKVRRKQLKDSQFCRQRIIDNYIVDFCCPKANLIIEIDGGQHYTNEGIKADKMRDNYMKTQGLQALRFSDKEVFEEI